MSDGESKGKIIKVVAPLTLPGGYTFDATVDGETQQVIVPEGGVKEGEVITVEIDGNNAAIAKVTSSKKKSKKKTKKFAPPMEGGTKRKPSIKSEQSMLSLITRKVSGNFVSNKRVVTQRKSSFTFAPQGHFRNGLCSCSQVICSGIFWMSLAFPCIVLSQLMQRLKLNIWGCRSNNLNYKTTCSTVLIVTVLLIIIQLPLFYFGLIVENDNSSILYTIALGVHIYTAILLFYWNVLLRYQARQRFGIAPECCGCEYDYEGYCGMCHDCCTVLWCNCCSLVQISRHTHDEHLYPYRCCSKNGLSADAHDTV